MSEDRHLAGVLAERRLGATVHVLDDGFQHLTLARDLDVLVTSRRERSRMDASCHSAACASAIEAAARAHLVVVVGADPAAARDRGLGARCQPVVRRPALLRVACERSSVLRLPGSATRSSSSRGSATPAPTSAATKAFPDHHRYTASDVRAIADAARAAGADTVLDDGEGRRAARAARPGAVCLDRGAALAAARPLDELDTAIAGGA